MKTIFTTLAAALCGLIIASCDTTTPLTDECETLCWKKRSTYDRYVKGEASYEEYLHALAAANEAACECP